MKSLVSYYSRSGNTRFVAERITDYLDADVEEVIDKVDRSGRIGWIKSGVHAIIGMDTEIGKLKYFPSDHELIILGSPVWCGKITPAMRTYIKKNDFSDNQVAFFNTNDSDWTQNTFDEMKKILGINEPINKIVLSKPLADQRDSEEKIQEWCNELRSKEIK